MCEIWPKPTIKKPPRTASEISPKLTIKAREQCVEFAQIQQRRYSDIFFKS